MDPRIQSDTKQRMDKTIEALRGDFSKLRTGRASVSILEGIRVDCYGNLMPLQQVATLSVSDSRTIVIGPWDKSVIGEIERSIHKSELGLNPINDGKVIRITIPPLTEERRKEMVKVAKRLSEECRVAVRNTRRDANESIKKIQKDGKITEDDLKKWETEVQKMTDQATQQIDSLLAHKEKEILEV